MRGLETLFVVFRYNGSNMATTYEQQESEEDGDPWKDSSLQNTSPHNEGGANQISENLIEKSTNVISYSTTLALHVIM